MYVQYSYKSMMDAQGNLCCHIRSTLQWSNLPTDSTGKRWRQSSVGCICTYWVSGSFLLSSNVSSFSDPDHSTSTQSFVNKPRQLLLQTCFKLGTTSRTLEILSFLLFPRILARFLRLAVTHVDETVNRTAVNKFARYTVYASMGDRKTISLFFSYHKTRSVAQS